MCPMHFHSRSGGTHSTPSQESLNSIGVPRRALLKTLLAAGMAAGGLGLDRGVAEAREPEGKISANVNVKAQLARIGASGKSAERLQALKHLEQYATEESADWIVKVGFNSKADPEVKIAALAALNRICDEPKVARHLVSRASSKKDLFNPAEGAYLLAAALGVKSEDVVAPLRAFLDAEGAKVKKVYDICAKAAELVGQVNEAAHCSEEAPTGHSVEALINICRLRLLSDGPKYEKGAPTLRRSVVQGFIACHETRAVDSLFVLAPILDGEASLHVLAYLHEISGEFLSSDFEQWARWWSEKGRTSALPERRYDREDKLGVKKKVVIVWSMGVEAGKPISWEANQKAVCRAIADLDVGSEFEIWQDGRRYNDSVALKVTPRVANAAGKASAVEEVMRWTVADGVGGGAPPLPYVTIAQALRDPKVTDIIYIQSARSQTRDETDPSGGQFQGRSFVELISGANRHRDQGGKSINCVNIYPGQESQRIADLLARKNWGNSYDIGSHAEYNAMISR